MNASLVTGFFNSLIWGPLWLLAALNLSYLAFRGRVIAARVQRHRLDHGETPLSDRLRDGDSHRGVCWLPLWAGAFCLLMVFLVSDRYGARPAKLRNLIVPLFFVPMLLAAIAGLWFVTLNPLVRPPTKKWDGKP